MTRSAAIIINTSEVTNVDHLDDSKNNEEASFFTRLRRRSSAVIADLLGIQSPNKCYKRRNSSIYSKDEEEMNEVGLSRRKSIPAYLGKNSN